MPFISRIEVRAFSRATEVPERVEDAVLNLFPEAVREHVKLTREETEGHLHTPIIVIEGTLKKKKSCNETLTFLSERLSFFDKMTIMETLLQRLDEQCNLFIRFDKQDAFLGDLRLATGPDLLSMKIHLLEYPRCTQSHVREMMTERFGLTEES